MSCSSFTISEGTLFNRGKDKMRSIHTSLAVMLVLAFAIQSNPATAFSRSAFIDPPLQGGPDSQTVQRGWEEKFRAVPAPDSAREHLRRLTAVPHVAGTK